MHVSSHGLGSARNWISVFAPLVALFLTGCGGAAPVPPRSMVGETSSISGLTSRASLPSWDTQVKRAGYGTQGALRSRLSLPRHRPKGGGIFKVGRPYEVKGRKYTPRIQQNYDQVGLASWYGADFDGKRTANGEVYDMRALTAAHKTLPMPSYAYVTNMRNNRTVLVRINDRGPFKSDRLIDLSERVSRELGFKSHGLAKVRVRYAGRAPLDGNDKREQAFLKRQSWHRHAAR